MHASAPVDPQVPRRAVAIAATVYLFACAPATPPPDFAPDASIVEAIESIRIDAPLRACPGQEVSVTYDALLEGGFALPFVNYYDDRRPPTLHLTFLSRQSGEATALDNGSWRLDADPLSSAMEGFRLSAYLKGRPSLRTERVVEPEYSCSNAEMVFRGQPGQPGPDVIVRLDELRSPFHDHLIVAEILAAGQEPVYAFADADAVGEEDWLLLESRGGRGQPGRAGDRGTRGGDGGQCQPGGAGMPGYPGGKGGRGSAGGSFTIIVPAERAYLARLVRTKAPGGRGGLGGRGGRGGAGGAGGPAGPNCAAGASGPRGRDGNAGMQGIGGPPGPPGRIHPALTDVFRRDSPMALRALIAYSR